MLFIIRVVAASVQADDLIPSGCEAIDELLGGGFERQTVTQVYGAPASGKTNLALSLTIETAKNGGTVLYIDTEGMSSERLAQIAASRVDGSDEELDTVLNRVIVSGAHTFDEQEQVIREASDVAGQADLVVLDSATGFYRLERAYEEDDDAGAALRRLADQVVHLLGLARRHDLAVVITNQVFSDPEREAIRPLGGYTLEHWSGTILRMDRYRGGKRRVLLEKHRSRRAGESALVQITGDGIADAVDPGRTEI